MSKLGEKERKELRRRAFELHLHRCATRGEECVQIRHDPARLIQKPGPRDGRHGSASRSVEEANPDPTFKGREFSAQSRLFHAKDIGGTGKIAFPDGGDLRW